MSQAQKDYVVEYRRALKAWSEKNLADKMTHNLAAATAADKHRLTKEEQQAVDKWLDEQYPVRTQDRKPDDVPLLFKLNLPEVD